MPVKIIHGDCLQVLPQFPSGTIDACITDPPYGIKMHDEKWDSEVPGIEYWREVLRLLKPGAHLAAFSSTRTSHRLAIAIEDAGFEIRDMLMWVTANGLNKSKDVTATIDRWGGDKDIAKHRRALAEHIKERRERAGISLAKMGKWFSKPAVVVNWQRIDYGFRVPSELDYRILIKRLGCSPAFLAAVRQPAQRAVVSRVASVRGRKWTRQGKAGFAAIHDITTPATPEAKRWHGWGACLSPAVTPIVLARKPFKGSSLGQNLLSNGAGALNLDGCRTKRGRLPSNFIHDGSEDALIGFSEIPKAARYFYALKPSKEERERFDHPTPKPIALMRWLVQLLTPPGGVVLDPFAGSGTTGAAAVAEGAKAILIERDPAYVALTRKRLRRKMC